MKEKKIDKTTWYEKVGISNPARFWTGSIMVFLEIAMIYGIWLSFLNWAWFTKEVAIGLLILILVISYNVFAGILILKGSKGKSKEK